MDFDSDNRYNWDISINTQVRPLWPYIRNAGVYKCPADRSYVVGQWQVPASSSLDGDEPVRWGLRAERQGRHHARRTDGGHRARWLYGLRAADRHLGRFFARPGQDLCFSGRAGRLRELGQFRDLDGGLPDQSNLYSYFEDLPGIYHNRGCGFSFADGHSEMHKWLGWMPAMHYEEAYWQNASFQLPNDPDIAWLQDHSTRSSTPGVSAP